MTSVADRPPRTGADRCPTRPALLPTDTKLEMPMFSRARVVEDREAERAALRRHRDPAGRRYTGENVAFNRTAGSVFRRPMQFGPMSRHARGANLLDHARLERVPPRSHSPKPALITTIARTPLRDAVVDRVEHVRGGDDDHGQVD